MFTSSTKTDANKNYWNHNMTFWWESIPGRVSTIGGIPGPWGILGSSGTIGPLVSVAE